ncbi:MAG: hypothetical protein H0X33_05195 [Taibaiella sp.]|nr:hypothetical protein [Taibaiella sp.]
MKSNLTLFIAFVLLISCNKKDTTTNNGTATVLLATQDSVAAVNMQQEEISMSQMLDSMLGTPHHTLQVHWDSLYHYHDSLFWHHHDFYHHHTASDDDHHHEWMHEDSTSFYHHHHYHHHYPGHEMDSLIIITDHPGHDNSDHHFHGHTLTDHHIADSLYEVDEHHHP